MTPRRAARWLGTCVALPLAAAADSGVAPFGFGGFGRDEPISITADRLEARDGDTRQLAFRRNVRVRQGALTLSAQVLEARYPEGDRQPEQLWARGDVRIREGARRAHCREAHYDRPGQRIVCRGAPAELWDGEDHLTGGEVVFDLARRSVRVEQGTELVIHRDLIEAGADAEGSGPESGAGAEGSEPASEEVLERLQEAGPLTIRAARREAHEQDDARRISFDGDVVARQGEVELRSRALEATYPPGATRPDRLVAREEVVIREGRREARCERAEYRPAERTVACEGEARLRDADDVFEAERIRFDFAARRVVAEGRARLRVDPENRERRGDR